jgi:hypothetical protein
MRDELVRVQQENGKQRPLLGGAQTQDVAVGRSLEGPEQPKANDAR